MNLREEILKEHSKTQTDKIVKWIGADQKRFDQLFDIFLNDENRVVQRAAWAMSFSVIANPGLIDKHWNKLIKNMQRTNLHNAVKRNSIRLMQHINIPKKYQGDIMNICFNYLESPTEMLAVKVFSMIVLEKLSGIYPEIIPELKILVEDQIPNQTAAFKNRGKKLLQKFSHL